MIQLSLHIPTHLNSTFKVPVSYLEPMKLHCICDVHCMCRVPIIWSHFCFFPIFREQVHGGFATQITFASVSTISCQFLISSVYMKSYLRYLIPIIVYSCIPLKEVFPGMEHRNGPLHWKVHPFIVLFKLSLSWAIVCQFSLTATVSTKALWLVERRFFGLR